MKKILLYVLLLAIPLSSLQASIVVPAHEPDPVTVKAAIAELKNLPRKERKERIKEAKKQLKAFKKEKKAGRGGDVDKVVLIILAILLPPLAVYLHQGEINGKFWISLLLTLLFILPGIIYALLVVLDEA
jgi:uncharacterized membrane protein YqaE (UPF0057 family)